MAKKKPGVLSYSPDGWFLNFLFLALLIVGIVSATVLVQRRVLSAKAAALQKIQQDALMVQDY